MLFLTRTLILEQLVQTLKKMSSSHNLATLAGGNYCIDQIMFIKFELVKNVCDCRLFLVLYVMNHFRFIFNNCLLLIMVEIEKVEAIFQRVKGVEKVVSGRSMHNNQCEIYYYHNHRLYGWSHSKSNL